MLDVRLTVSYNRSVPDDPRIQVRLPQRLYDCLTAYVERRRAGRPGLNITRSDVIRELLYALLPEAAEEPGVQDVKKHS